MNYQFLPCTDFDKNHKEKTKTYDSELKEIMPTKSLSRENTPGSIILNISTHKYHQCLLSHSPEYWTN